MMSKRVRVSTAFDCSATGVTGHFRQNKLPIKTLKGENLDNPDAWNRARNQQRNFESITQLVSLFTQLENLTDCEYNMQDKCWQFEFTTEFDGVFQNGISELGALEDVCKGVPMIVGLNETDVTESILVPGVNIHFDIVD